MENVFGNDFDYKEGILSSWAGIRPLVKELEGDQKKKNEENRTLIKQGLFKVETGVGKLS
jgi:glycerol-3-phosphate dehydrogenase